MANHLLTPEWINNQLFNNTISVSSGGEVWYSVPGTLGNISSGTVTSYGIPFERAVPPQAPMDAKTVVALGAAAIVASPRKISRRSLFGLGWKSR